MVRLYYGLTVSLFLAAANLKTAPFFLPLLLYLAFSACRQTVKYLQLIQLIQTEPVVRRYFDRFSWEGFFLQPSFSFRLSLVLLLITLITVASYQPRSILSPLP